MKSETLIDLYENFADLAKDVHYKVERMRSILNLLKEPKDKILERIDPISADVIGYTAKSLLFIANVLDEWSKECYDRDRKVRNSRTTTKKEEPVEVELNSSLVKRVAWTGDELTVTLENGKSYIYSNVPETVFQGIVKAESAGRYFSKNIRGKYPHRAL